MTNDDDDDDERVRAEPEQAPATQALPQWVPFGVAAVWLSSRDYSFAKALADQNSLRIELALSTANWTKYSHTEAAESSIERFRAAYPIPIEDEQLTWSLWLALPPDKREVEIQAAERYGADLKHIKCHPYAAHRWLEKPISNYEEAQGVLIQGMKDGSIRSTGTPFGLPTATPFGWLSVASGDRLGCEISPYNIRALELEDNVRLPNGNFTVRLVTEDRRAGFNNLHVFGANVACLIGSAQFQGDPAFVELANSGSDADDRSEADNATLRPADRLACVGGDEMTPSTPSTILARPGMCPRKRGPKPVRLEKTRAAMRFKLKADSTYREELEKTREKELAATYGVSRDTARKARKAVLSEFAENSDRDK